jgi:hypothetical protein
VSEIHLYFFETEKNFFYPHFQVSRPSTPLQESGIAAAIKLFGGTPHAGHNHDDAGSYVLTVNGVLISGDIGGPKRFKNIP